MSEQPDDKQEPEENQQGRTTRVILAIIVTVMLSAVLSWLFVPSVRALGYQTILIVGPVDARKWSVRKLKKYKELAVRPLAIALGDNDRWIRESAAQALGEIGPKAEKAIPALIEALKDKSDGVRSNAAYALGKIGPKAKKTVPALIEALKDKSDGVRSNAAYALGRIGPKAEKAVPALIQALNDGDRIGAALALWQITSKTEKAVPVLTKALKDKDRNVRRAAKEALDKIHKNRQVLHRHLIQSKN